MNSYTQLEDILHEPWQPHQCY